MSEVELSVRSALSKVIDELNVIKEKATETGQAFGQTGDGVTEGLKKNVKQTETFFGELRGVSRRIADQLRGDFKSLISVNALTDAMKLSNQFRKNISETVELNDAVRKLGRTFGLAATNYASFQAKLSGGLGELGLGSDVGVRTMNGLAQTPVRGQANIVGYSQQAGMLASTGNERGQEGDIARSLAKVLQAQGGDVNDPKQVLALAETVRRISTQTGVKPSAALKNLEDIFRTMPEDMRKALNLSALSSLSAASAVGGPSSTKFLEEYLGKSPIARQAFEAQGGKGIVTDDGIDTDKFKKFADSILSRVGGDPRLAAQTLGLSEEAAEGFVRLNENIEKVAEAQKKIAATTGNLNEQYRASMGLGEAFAANINRVKSSLATPLSWATQKATGALSGAAGSDAGAATVSAAAAVAAAVLAGFGLKGVGAGIGSAVGTVGRKEGAESLLGAKTVPVYVVNASEIGGGGLGGLLGGGAAAAAGGAGAAGGTGLIGLLGPFAAILGLGAALHSGKEAVDADIAGAGKNTTGQQYPQGMLEILKRQLDAGEIPEKRKAEVEQILRDQYAGAWQPAAQKAAPPPATGSSSSKGALETGSRSGAPFPGRPQKVVVELVSPGLKASVQPTRGATN